MKLQELIETKIKILSEKKTKDGDVMNVSVPCIKSDIRNKNGRIYKKSLLQREIAKVQKSIEQGSFIGTGDHPKSGIADVETASHIVTALSLDDKGQGWAELRILPTSRGKNIQTLVRNGATLGVSFRGFGEIGKDGTVLDSYSLAGIDIVTNPSDDTAHFDLSNIFESINFGENLDDERKKDLEEAVNDLETESYLSAVESGFKGTQAEYEQLCGGNLRRMMGLEESTLHTVEKKKLTEEQKIGRIQTYFFEAMAAGFHGNLEDWKKQFPQLVKEARGEDIPLKVIKEQAEPDYHKLITAYQESVSAGFSGNFESWKEKYPKIVESVLEPKPEKKDPLEEEALRIFEGLKKANPNSALEVEHVRDMLLKEQEPKRERKIREWAIYRVSKSLAGSGAVPSQEIRKQMVEDEIRSIKEEKELKKKRNWEAYKKLLS